MTNLAAMTDLADLFAQKKYVVVRSCVKDPELSLLYRYACKRAQIGTMFLDGTSSGAWSAPGDCFMDGLLMDLLPFAEEVSRTKLFPTYSYFRVYSRGDVLEKHTDRPSCEISLSLCLGYQAERPWPLQVEGPAGASSVELAPGDGLLYRGIECPHWREPMDGEQTAQVFLHYVDQNGPYAEWKYDKRPALSFKKPHFGK
ncbi:MAG TPA: hypothetical protein VGJ48_26630 [Pyrinomonadaceae bacterium]|jgi:hypothetical protein